MPVFEFHVAVHDKTNQNDKLRHDEGDIVNIRSEGVEIGRKVLDTYLIIPIDLNTARTAQDLRQRYCIPLYDDGSIEYIDWRHIRYPEDGVDPEQYPHTDYVWSLTSPGVIAKPTKIAKNRYKIAFSSSKFAVVSLDLDKVRNTHAIYQPFLKESRIAGLPCFTRNDSDFTIAHDGTDYHIRRISKNTRRVYKKIINGKAISYIRRNEEPQKETLLAEPEYKLEMTTPVVGREAEVKFTYSAQLEIIQDKFDDSYLSLNDLTREFDARGE